jgi:hypothetical protein
MNEADKTWLLRFSGVGQTDPSQRDDYTNLPTYLTIPDDTGKEHFFKLQAATIHQINHFVSLQNYQDEMIFFDGMGERGGRAFHRRFRTPLPSDTDPEGPKKANLNTIVYLRQF